MDAEKALEAVSETFDTLVSAGTEYGGLFPSIADRETGAPLSELPDPIVGRRNNDRSFRGANLMHDHPALRAMLALAEHDGRDEYADAVDRYLERFATHCTDTPTGLFPWGEHSYWHLDADEPGNSYGQNPVSEAGGATHDHLRTAPGWLWDRLTRADRDCLQRFADGLDYHWQGVDRREYNRHASIFDRERDDPTGDRACDFPPHGGYLLVDWAVAYSHLRREWPRQQIVRMMDYWWDHRTEWGLLPLEARGRTEELSAGMTLSFAVSLLDAADRLSGANGEPELVERLREHATTYFEGFLAAPHDTQNGVFLVACRPSDVRSATFQPRDAGEGHAEIKPMSTWGSVYGSPGDIVAKHALLACRAYRHTGDERLLTWARDAGEAYAADSFPGDGLTTVTGVEVGNDLTGDEKVPVIAGDPGLVIGLMIDLYDLTGEQRWLNEADRVVEVSLDRYFDAPLPRGATTVDYYDSEMKPAYLLYNLTRYGLLVRDDVDIGPDYTDR